MDKDSVWTPRLDWHVRTCEAWDEIPPEHVASFVREYYSTTNSQSEAIRSFREFARRFYPEIPEGWVKRCKLQRQEFHVQVSKSRQRVAENAVAPLMCDVRKHLQVMCFMLAQEDDAASLALGLLMATGRRTAEIASESRLTATRKAHEPRGFWLRFVGPVKGKAKGVELKRAWDIPVLVSAEQLLAKFQRFRTLVCGDQSCNNVKSGLWQREVKRLLHEHCGPEMLPKSCRAVYATLSHEMFNPIMAINMWVMQILGHTDIRTSHSYLNVHLFQVARPLETYGIELAPLALGECRLESETKKLKLEL